VSKILVTPRSLTRAGGHPALDKLRQAGHEILFCTPGQQPDEAELAELLPECVGYLAGVERISEAVLEAARQLRVISRNGVGVDNVDLAAAERLGIAVCKTPGANARGVAELAIGLAFSLARAIPPSDAALKRNDWERTKGFELAGKTMGVIGCGAIGREVSCMALGVGMHVLAYDPGADAAFDPGPDFRYGSIDEVLEQADVISLHCPGSDRPLLDASALGRMKKGACIINTARPSLIDAPAVLAALDDGNLAGAALDVFEHEPPTDNPLAHHVKVIATPHIGGFTAESVDRAVDAAVENLLAELAGAPAGRS
jgi:phosphoglycerate dehydrogenase-like enzyme